MRLVVLVVLGAAGCDIAFGLDRLDGMTIRLTFERQSVGSTIATAPFDVTGMDAAALVEAVGEPGGYRRVAATRLASGDGFTVSIPPGAPPVIEYTFPDYPGPRQLAFGQHDLRLAVAYYEQAEPAPALGGAIEARLALPSALTTTDQFHLYSVGAWVRHVFTASELPAAGASQVGPVLLPYNTTAFPSVVAATEHSRITADDTLVGLRYQGARLIAAGVAPPIDQTGGTDRVDVTLADVPPDMLDVRLVPNSATNRLANTRPAATSTTLSWALAAAPGAEMALLHGPLLNSGTVIETSPFNLVVPFGNPFVDRGWSSVLTWAAVGRRMFQPTSPSLPVTMTSALYQFATPERGLALDHPSGLPALISIDRVAMITDGMQLAIDRSRPVVVELVADRTGNLYYQFIVYELVPNAAGTALEYKLVYVALTAEPRANIPSTVFVTGGLYTVRGMTLVDGYPGFGRGDFTTRELPHSLAYLDGGAFTVVE